MDSGAITTIKIYFYFFTGNLQKRARIAESKAYILGSVGAVAWAQTVARSQDSTGLRAAVFVMSPKFLTHLRKQLLESLASAFEPTSSQ